MSGLDPRKKCPLCAELGKSVSAEFGHAWYNSHETEPDWPGLPPRPKRIGVGVDEYEALPEEEKAGYYRGERWACGRVDRGLTPATRFYTNEAGEHVSEEIMSPLVTYLHKWNVWDKDGEAKWSRSTCVHGVMWTSVVPCRECGSFDVMLSPYDPDRSKEEIRRRAKVELEKRIRNIRGGHEAGQAARESE